MSDPVITTEQLRAYSDDPLNEPPGVISQALLDAAATIDALTAELARTEQDRQEQADRTHAWYRWAWDISGARGVGATHEQMREHATMMFRQRERQAFDAGVAALEDIGPAVVEWTAEQRDRWLDRFEAAFQQYLIGGQR